MRSIPDDFRKKLGSAIAIRRKQKKLTQDDLAFLVEVDAETISRFERGTSLPSLERLWVLADALGTGMNELLLGVSALPEDRAVMLVSTFKTLGERDQKLLQGIAEVFRD